MSDRKNNRIIRNRETHAEHCEQHVGCPFCGGAKIRPDWSKGSLTGWRACESFGLGGRKDDNDEIKEAVFGGDIPPCE